MAKIGQMNRLKIVNILDFGAFLDGGLLDDILMPRRFVPKDCNIGDEVDVFIYLDSNDIPIATTLRPKAQVGQFACLKVSDVNRMGAFLDWNMPKDLLVPYSEQKHKMEKDPVPYSLCLSGETKLSPGCFFKNQQILMPNTP